MAQNTFGFIRTEIIRGWYAVAQLFEALRYKPEGCGFDSWRGGWNFHWFNPSGPHHGPWGDWSSSRN